ncbi:hypothetical protein BZG01_00225 [Labilibaculum manganireducens]|uniref:Phage tail tape measure protein domain-containing protein n=1 Tax=Labilibaculum manganireducens TaxID=1940525 RepID=A0A2N3IGF8_9BACT|nr:phage tail tape measure protein [Labilibaculum manganireducens]PKQ69399.1 hypothetical protein BZG01_00225 [Labilibaculum manganireducens]
MSDKTYKYILDFAAKTDKFSKQVTGVEGLLKSAAVAAGALFAADKIFDAAGAAGEYASEISTIRQNIEKLQGVQGTALNEATGGAKALADAYDADVNESIIASNVLMKTFRDSSSDAFNVLNKGFATTANSNGDFLKQVSEYAPHFKEAGLAAAEMVAIIAEGNKNGIFDDKAADAIKEGSIRLREMTKSTKDAIGQIGLSSTQIQKDISTGAKSMFDVMQDVSRQLQTLPAQSPAVGAALADIFGGPGEDGIEFIRTLADINVNLDDVVSHSGASASAQKAWADQLKEFHTLSANVFKDWNKWILSIKSKALGFATGFVNNMDDVVDVLKIGASGLVAYKTATVLASVGTANYSRIMVRARKAQQALNLAMKSNPIGLVAALLATAAAAYLTYSIHIDGATASQKKFNEAQEDGAKLLADVSSVESTYKVINHLNRRQLEDFKTRAQEQLTAWEDVQKQVTETTYQEYKKRKAAIVKEMDETVKKLVSSGEMEESEAKRQAEATSAYKLNQLKRWFNDTVSKQTGVTSTEIVENQKRLKNYISTADKMLAVAKKTKKEIAKAPEKMDMPRMDLSEEEVDYDPFDMSDADGRATMYSATLGELNEKIRQSIEWNKLFGNSHFSTQEQIKLTEDAINSMIENGFNAADPAVQALIDKLDVLQKKFSGPQKAMAMFADRMDDMKTKGAESFGDLAKAAGNAAREIIRAYIAEGVASIIKDTLKFYGWTGPGAIALAAGAGAGASTLFNTLIPAFAGGAVVSGPTLALTGEYPGAINNPEWVGKRSEMLGDMKTAVRETGGGGGNFSFRFEDGALVAYLNHQNRKVGGFA